MAVTEVEAFLTTLAVERKVLRKPIGTASAGDEIALKVWDFVRRDDLDQERRGRKPSNLTPFFRPTPVGRSVGTSVHCHLA